MSNHMKIFLIGLSVVLVLVVVVATAIPIVSNARIEARYTRFDRIGWFVTFDTNADLYNVLIETVHRYHTQRVAIFSNRELSRNQQYELRELLRNNYSLQLSNILQNSRVYTGFSDDFIIESLKSDGNDLRLLINSINDNQLAVSRLTSVEGNDFFMLMLAELYRDDIVQLISESRFVTRPDHDSVATLIRLESIIYTIGVDAYNGVLPLVQEALEIARNAPQPTPRPEPTPRPTPAPRPRQMCQISEGCNREATHSITWNRDRDTRYFCRAHFNEMQQISRDLGHDITTRVLN